MNKRFISLLLCLLLLASLPLTVFADGEEPAEEAELTYLSISSVKEFLRFAESCRLDAYSKNLAVSLECDLDLSGEDFQGIPIFFGSFDGKGHSISGLNITVESSAVGLFRYLEENLAEEEYIVLSTTTKNCRSILHFYLDELDMKFWSARLFKKIRKGNGI